MEGEVKKIIIRGPISDVSGYARVTRQIFFSLYNTRKYDVILAPLQWVNSSPLSFPPEISGTMKQASSREVSYHDATCIQVTIAKEFKKLGKYNIGVTTLETDAWLEEWVDKCNQMDELWVLSEQNLKAAIWSGVKVPIRIVPLGVDFSKFPAKGEFPYKFATDFNFLVSGQWQGYDRKNIAKTIKIFFDAFKENRNVGLVLKTFCNDNSTPDFYRTQGMIDQLVSRFRKGEFPKVYLIHGTFRDAGMQQLFSHPQIKAVVSFSKGEGLWWDGLNAVAAGKPIVCTGWGGQTDYLDSLHSLFVDYSFTRVNARWKGVYSTEQRWAEVDENDAKEKLNRCYENYENLEKLAIEYRDKVKEERDISIISAGIEGMLTPTKRDDSALSESSVAMILTQTMGDVIAGTSIAKAVLRSYPPCKITWFVDSRFTNILDGSPVLENSKISIVKVTPSDDVYAQTNAISKTFYNEKYDRVLTLSPLFEPRWQELTRNFVEFRAWQSGVRLIPEDYFYYVSTSPEDEKKIDELNLPKDFVVIHTRGGWIQKDWTAGKWKKLVKRLERDGIGVCQVGGPKDVKVCKKNFAGKLTFRETFALIKRAKLFVGPVSGCAHYAKAARKPLIILEGCSSAVLAGLTKHYEDVITVRTTKPCEMACEKNYCKWNLHEGKGCAIDIAVDEVYEAVKEKLV